MTTAPSADADDLFDEDEEEVLPVGAPGAPSPPKPNLISKVLPDRSLRGRPVYKIIAEQGEGNFRCGNCQLLNTPWRRNVDKRGPKKSCADFGVQPDSRPCSFSLMDPLKRFNPITFGDIGIGPDMTMSDIQLTRILLNRREEELQLAASMPFKIGDKVQFIYKNKYTIGTVESYNRANVFVKVKDFPTPGNEQILALVLGSVTKA